MGEALKRARVGFVVSGVFSLFLNLLMLVSPLYMLQVYDRVLTTGSRETLLYLTLMAVLALLVMGALEGLRTSALARIGMWIGRSEGSGLLRRSVKSSLAGQSIGAQPLRDLGQVLGFISQGLSTFFDAPWVPIFLAFIWMLHPWMGVLALVAAILLFSIAIANDRITRVAYAQANQAQMAAMSQAETMIRNAEVVQAMGMLPALLRKWGYFDSIASTNQVAGAQRGGAMLGLSKFVRLAVQVGILGLGALLVLEGEVSAGAMIAGSILLGRALAPVEQAIGAWRSYGAARLAYERLEKLTNAIPEEKEAMSLPAPEGEVRVEGVTFLLPGSDRPILRNVSFGLRPGEVLGMIGPSAAGKSTLCRLLVGVWKPRRGHVRIDGADVGAWNREELGRHMGYLPQDVELFAGTVRENIARMQEGEPEQVVAAAKLADVHEMILRLPDAYDTQIGTQGANLSGGQRQRIGLARALYGQPRVVVLDEPNANLDQAGEAALIDTIGRLRAQGVTIILVAHRLAALRQIDKLLILENGTIADFGPRDEVLNRLRAAREEAAQKADTSGAGSETGGIAQLSARVNQGNPS